MPCHAACAGDADEIHPCVGRALRMMVPQRDRQAEILVQAVQNHNPQVLIVDEIGTKEVRQGAWCSSWLSVGAGCLARW